MDNDDNTGGATGPKVEHSGHDGQSTRRERRGWSPPKVRKLTGGVAAGTGAAAIRGRDDAVGTYT